MVVLLRVLLSLVLSLICTSSAQANNKVSPPKYVTLPVYFVTDRNQEGNTFGSRRRYPSNCQHHMYYGTAFVTVENHRHEESNTALEALGWKFGMEKPKGKFHNELIDPAAPVKSKNEFFEHIKQALDQASTDQLCVYVHGAEEGFEDACDDAAEVAYALHRPLVLYSWPSEPKLLDYVIDNGNSEWSQGHFNLFCRNLLTLKETHPLHLIMLAHSMGNRFLFRAMHFLYQTQLISDCEFVSPDMDIDTCGHYLMGFSKIDYKTAMRLYVSNKDKMLRLSQSLFGGYARLGEDVPSHLVPDKDVDRLIVHKDNPAKKDKAAVKETAEETVIPEVEASEEATSAASVLERIDFTDIDEGFTGHSFPFQLVGDMVDGKKTFAGIEVVAEKNDKSGRKVKVVKQTQVDKVDSSAVKSESR